MVGEEEGRVGAEPEGWVGPRSCKAEYQGVLLLCAVKGICVCSSMQQPGTQAHGDSPGRAHTNCEASAAVQVRDEVLVLQCVW